MNDVAVAALLGLGGGFACLAGIGMLRMPDLMTRMHASTKAGTLGVGLIAIAAAVAYGTAEFAVRCALVVVFLLLTAPVGAHLIARAAHRRGVAMTPRTRIDDLRTYEDDLAGRGK